MTVNPAKNPLEAAVEDRRLSMRPVPQKQEIARRAGVTASYLRRVLSGRNPLSAEIQARLEQALELPRHSLAAYRAGDDTGLAAPPPGSKYTQKEWDRLDADERRLLYNIHRKLQAQDAGASTDAQETNHPNERQRKRGA